MMTAKRKNHTRCLGDLLEGLKQPEQDLAVIGLQLDSRKVNDGDLFLAFSGFAVDGRDYIDHAIDSGAIAVLVEKDEKWQLSSYYRDVPLIIVEGLKEQLSEIAGRFYGHPSRALPLIGVTGTNGKTSCCHLIMQLLNALGQSCAIAGTLGNGVDGKIQEGLNTTADAVSIQQLLSLWQTQTVNAVAMEVSSHGLDQKRVAALEFQVALVTNLSRDHLDYHQSMEQYAQAKAELLIQPGLKTAVINIDDAYGDFFLRSVPVGVQGLGYSLDNSAADIWLENIEFSLKGVTATLHSPWGSAEFFSHLSGRFNLSNLIAVIAALCAIGVSFQDVLAAVSALRAVPGRMEAVSSDADVQVIVDYAHTPAAMEAALEAMSLHKEGQLWCVFGCGGDRDRGKRAQMAAVAERLADRIIVTSDNPRTESAAAIIGEICAGFSGHFEVEVDRANAIALAISEASPGDSILIAGKGHEDYQQVGQQRLPFSDVQQARFALVRRRAL
jgi:UDP-N-acetylmuramoyl-L-alanyl-D-glutamate--2,6-diaminopimelate ligase